MLVLCVCFGSLRFVFTILAIYKKKKWVVSWWAMKSDGAKAFKMEIKSPSFIWLRYPPEPIRRVQNLQVAALDQRISFYKSYLVHHALNRVLYRRWWDVISPIPPTIYLGQLPVDILTLIDAQKEKILLRQGWVRSSTVRCGHLSRL